MKPTRNSLLWSAALALMLSAPAAHALSPEVASRLQQRAGLGPDPHAAAALQLMSLPRAIDRLVDDARAAHRAQTPPPDWADEPLARPASNATLTADERRARQRQIAQRGAELQGWWMHEMLSTPSPLAERMTLFWHGHFTSGLREVRSPQLLYQQNVLLREHALGNYRTLLTAVVRDPAMLLYLNNQQNRRDAPNENFARELLELFTLGEGHYTERDVHEAARAFTGWRMQPTTGEFVIAPRLHDDGDKEFLGARGALGGDEVVAQILKQPRAAEFIVEKLWREFVSPQPDARAVRRLAADFRRDWEIAPLLKALLRRAALDSPRNQAALVKSPVEFVVGTLRTLDLPVQPRVAALAVGGMGQQLFAPPNVRGWPGGESWITTQSLLARRQFVLTISGQRADPSAADETADRGVAGASRRRAEKGARLATPRLGAMFGERAEAHAPDWAARELLPRSPVTPAEPGATPAERLQAALLDPAYQLK